MPKMKYYDGSQWFELDAKNADTVDNKHASEFALASDVGSKSTLLTTDKSSFANALNELFTNANNGKTNVRTAIVGKGGTVPTNPTFTDLVTAINNVATWDTDLIAANIKSGVNILGVAGTFVGAQQASGTATTSLTSGAYTIEVTGLAFTPDIIVITKSGLSKYPSVAVYNRFVYNDYSYAAGVWEGAQWNTSNGLSTNVTTTSATGNQYVYNNAFKLYAYNSTYFTSMNWYAYKLA